MTHPAPLVVGESSRSADDELRLPRPPGILRRFWARHPRLTDWLLVGLAVLLTAPTFVLSDDLGPVTDDPALLITWVALCLASSLSLLWRRHHPLTVFAVALSPLLLLDPNISSGVAGIAPAIALYSVAVHRSTRAAAWLLGIAVAAIGLVAVLWSLAGALTDPGPMAVVTSMPLVLGALVGINIGGRKRYEAALIDRSRQLAIERDQQAQLAAAAERTRLARELHDIVSHSLAVVVTLAEGAVATSDAERARKASRAIADTARDSLEQMRTMLGVLRAGAEEDTPLEPLLAQTPADVVARAREAGYPVTLSTTGEPAGSAAQRLAVLRIVQEGLTNAMRYAHEPSRIAVSCEYAPERIRVVVDNDGVREGEPSRGAGLGLIGLTERVTALGGSLQAGPAASGIWRLSAELPREEA